MIKTVVNILCLILLSSKFGYSQDVIWPNGAKAAICLTYDDAMTTQLENALPALDSVGLKGTFFLNPTRSRSEILGWMNAAENQHELGNHSVLHPCPKEQGWDDRLTTDNYTVRQILYEIRTMNGFLNNLDSVRLDRSYAYPCSNLNVGGHSYVKDLKASQLIKYARKGGDQTSIVQNFKELDWYEVPSYEVQENTKASELIAFVDDAIEKNGLGVFMFHGINGQWFNVKNEDHSGLLKYLANNQKRVWVATFSDIMQHIELELRE